MKKIKEHYHNHSNTINWIGYSILVLAFCFVTYTHAI